MVTNLCKSLVIEDDRSVIYGIYRGSETSRKIIVFIPAITGTRIGPQRMFVEISNQVIKSGISTICTDMPMAGDSYDKNLQQKKRIREYYEQYLKSIYEYLQKYYPKSEIIFSSISVGCLPVLEFSERYGLQTVLLLSPNRLGDDISKIDKKNLKAYFYKILNKNTWIKLISFKLNYKNIYKNIFVRQRFKTTEKEPIGRSVPAGKVGLVCVFGDREPELVQNLEYWRTYEKENRFLTYKEIIISNAEHNFMDWTSKQSLIHIIGKLF